jgi:hypothetical protein
MEPNARQQQPPLQRISDAVLDAFFHQINILMRSKTFWAIIVAVISILFISWLCLQDVSATKTLALPQARHTINIGKFSVTVPAQFKTTDQNSAFFEARYNILLLGRLDSDKIGMLGITDDGKTFSYEKKMDISVMQRVKNVSMADDYIEVFVGRLWMETIMVIFLIILTTYIIILNIIRRGKV